MFVAVPALLLWAFAALALDDVVFTAPGADRDLERSLRGASLVLEARRDGRTGPLEIFSAAQADYGRLLGALYAAGYYSGVISVRIDGREAADIPPLNAPRTVRRVEIRVDPGSRFTFGRAAIGPLAPGTDLPPGFAPGAVAESGVIRDAAEAAVEGWRETGRPKAAIGRQSITAVHPQRRLDAEIEVQPGPEAVFGRLRFSGQERMREARLHKIAGFPEGARYSPEALRRAADRLRRTGVFRSVSLVEADRLGPGNTLDVDATVIEEVPRRFGFGAEVASFDGARLTAFWLHRNLLGGGERFRVEGEVAQIGARESGVDYRLGVSYERPATGTPDTTLRIAAEVAREQERDYRQDRIGFGLGAVHVFSDRLTVRGGIDYRAARVRDAGGRQDFRNLALPLGVLFDNRDNRFDATRGFYLDAEIRPFRGFGSTDSGARLVADGRAYRAVGERVVLAGRLQLGEVRGTGLLRTPRDYLFFSGGGGTVRGQPFQSLGINVARGAPGTPGTLIGGTRFLGASAEVRTRLTDTIGIVAFYDFGRVSVGGDLGRSHAGAGLGLRYATGIGPIRVDLAAPVGGTTGRGGQLYIGIGQAF
ncbi:MAG: autotransporter assembly complex protein TamA [Gemmobacter sp.]